MHASTAVSCSHRAGLKHQRLSWGQQHMIGRFVDMQSERKSNTWSSVAAWLHHCYTIWSSLEPSCWLAWDLLESTEVTFNRWWVQDFDRKRQHVQSVGDNWWVRWNKRELVTICWTCLSFLCCMRIWTHMTTQKAAFELARWKVFNYPNNNMH